MKELTTSVTCFFAQHFTDIYSMNTVTLKAGNKAFKYIWRDTDIF